MVLGSASRNSISAGISILEIFASRCFLMSSSVAFAPALSLMKAFGASPRYSSLMPMTVTSSTAGMLVDRLLDPARIDVVARADDQVLDAVDDEDEALLVHDADVAGAQVVADELVGGLLGLLPVALHHLRALDADLALLAQRHLLGGVGQVAQRDDRAGQRLADGALLDRAFERIAGDARARPPTARSPRPACSRSASRTAA